MASFDDYAGREEDFGVGVTEILTAESAEERREEAKRWGQENRAFK
jgi:hypothetical protein